MLYAQNPHYLMRCVEAKNIADMAQIYMQACLSREETRGLFNRSDFPEEDPSHTGKITYQKLVDGLPVVEKRPAPKLKAEYATEGGK